MRSELWGPASNGGTAQSLSSQAEAASEARSDPDTPALPELILAPPEPAVSDGEAESADAPETRLICLSVAYGDTLWGIARLFGVAVRDIVRLNAIENPDRIFPGQRLFLRVPASVPIAPCAAYTVRQGDTLSGIAARLGLDAAQLARKNGLFDPDVIFAGQTLQL